MSKKQTYRIARHCRLGGVGTEVQLSEEDAIALTNETPDALEGPFASSAAAQEATREPVRETAAPAPRKADKETA